MRVTLELTPLELAELERLAIGIRRRRAEQIQNAFVPPVGLIHAEPPTVESVAAQVFRAGIGEVRRAWYVHELLEAPEGGS